MNTVDSITTAIAELPPEQVAQIRAWLNERAEAEWDAQIEQDDRGTTGKVAERQARHRSPARQIDPPRRQPLDRRARREPARSPPA